MTRSLGAVVRLESQARKKDNEVGKDLAKRIQVADLTVGHTKTFRPKDSDTPPEHYGHDEYKQVALTVRDVLAQSSRYAAEAMDLVATKDKTNQVANATIYLDGNEVLKDVPVSHLLWLQDYLTEWREKLIAILPVLNPTRKWSEVEGQQGLYQSAPETADRTVPEKVVISLTAATDKFPEKAELIDKRVLTGWFDSVVLSGAIFEDRKRKLIDNADRLIAAVKDAIQRANRTDAVEVTEGQTLMDLLLA